MRFIGGVIEKLQRHPKRIIFPEGAEPRVLQAARQFFSLRLGAPILLGNRTKIKETAEALNISLEGIRIINPRESDDLEFISVAPPEAIAVTLRVGGQEEPRTLRPAKRSPRT